MENDSHRTFNEDARLMLWRKLRLMRDRERERARETC
jgi:hypothetical protein